MCKIAVAASGTITLQIALKNSLYVYFIKSQMQHIIIKFLIKTNFISLINILLEKKVVQEFVQSQASEKNIIDEINKIIQI